MKKSTLALSIAAALGGMGLAGNALAVTDSIQGATANSVMTRNADGIGHQLVFPYFTAQNGNATLLSITNTDTAKGKLVKVRFRGAGNSDDLYDFTLALSPGDVWTASVTKDAATGAASLATSDKSCTLPASVNGTFNLQRVDGGAAAQTLEGYVEVLNMADIPAITATANSTTYTTALYTAIKHVNGVAPCTASILAAKLGADNTHANLIANQADGTNAVGLAVPTTGLTGDWIILNQTTTAAWSGSATALQVSTDATGATPANGNLVFFPQITGTPKVGGTAVAAATADSGQDIYKLTADPLLTSGVVAIQSYDLPDMSTPYAAVNSAGTAITTGALQADASTAQLAVKSVANQYVTDVGIAAVTDLLFSQPLRRYSAAVNYKSLSSTDAVGTTTVYPLNTTGARAQALYRGAWGVGSSVSGTTTTTAGYTGAASAYYGPSTGTASATVGANLSIPTGGRNLCLTTIKAPASNFIFDREETTPSASSSTASFVISPATVTTAATVSVCGEAAVISINNGGTTGASALSASLARSDFTSTSLTTYANGWVVFATNNGSTTGIPVLGQSFIRAANGSVNYGFGYANKVTR